MGKIPRGPYINELKSAGLTYGETKDGGHIYEPVFVESAEVFLDVTDKQYPMYSFYFTGTNSMTILKYDYEKDIWYKLNDPHDLGKDLYPLMWKMLYKLMNCECD